MLTNHTLLPGFCLARLAASKSAWPAQVVFEPTFCYSLIRGPISGYISINCQLGGELLLETIPDYISGKLVPQSQPAEGVTYFGMIKKEDGLLDFARPAVELERRIHAFSPWPGTFMFWNKAPLKIHKAHIKPGKTETGKQIVVDGLPAVGTADGLIVFDELQPAGKKSMPGKDFLIGYRGWESS